MVTSDLPLPAVPRLSTARDQAVLANELHNWYTELCIYRNINYGDGRWSSGEIPNEFERELRKLVRFAERCAQKCAKHGKSRNGDDLFWADTIATYKYFLGQCLSRKKKHEQAITEFQMAMKLSTRGFSLYIREGLIGALLQAGKVKDAAREMNHISPKLLASENDSTAQVFINWIIQFPELAAKVTPRLLKQCLLLVTKYCGNHGPKWRYALLAVSDNLSQVEAEWVSNGDIYLGTLTRK
jgi:hypothetical protein